MTEAGTNAGDEERRDDSSYGMLWGSGTYVVENQLPQRVRIRGDRGHVLILAPLERREIEGPALEPFDRESMVRGDQLLVAERSKAEQDFSGLFAIAFWGAVAYVYVGVRLDKVWFWLAVPAVAAIAGWVWRERVRKGGTELQRWVKQAMSLTLVALLAVGLPATVIWYGTGLDNLAQGARSVSDLLRASPQFLARFVQLLFIAGASLLPALMYFVFDREQLGTLKDRFIQQVFRLDPSLKRLGDLQAKYGPQIEEMYGPTRTSRARLLGGRLSPIVVATLFITVGWTLTLLNSDVLPGPGGDFPILALFVPDASVVSFAFLGAYFFAIQLVLRSYLRGDLRPKSYGHIAVRILIVLILAWVLQEIVGKDTAWLRASVFLAGIVPETALRWIREFVRGRGPQWAKGNDPMLAEPNPLSSLEGIDLYDLTRLTDEGVTNVEALAHHELVDLMLKTRIPAPRLVDWVDQAILYLHARGEISSGTDQETADTLWKQLKVYGIRTATDLQAACAAIPEAERSAFFNALGKDQGPPYRVQVILDTLADDEWLGCIRHWRRHPNFQTLVDIRAEHTQVSAAGVVGATQTEASANGEATVRVPESEQKVGQEAQ